MTCRILAAEIRTRVSAAEGRVAILSFIGTGKLASAASICSRCCHDIKNGLTADLIHLAAIVDLRRLGYVNQTLTRESLSTIEERYEKQHEEDLRAMMRVVK
jgi:hypothetical protein